MGTNTEHSILRRTALKALAGGTAIGGTAGVTGATPAAGRGRSVDDSQGCDFEAVAGDVVDSIVTVRVFDEQDREFVQGSGWVYDRDGDVVDIATNWHIVFTAVGADVRFADGEWRPATELLGVDRFSDLAVVRVEDAPEYAAPLSIVDEPPNQGDPVAAVGAPIGLERTITTGVVSAVGRATTVSFEYFQYNVPNTIQIDAATNPGNSGGPTVDCDGEVIGVNFAGTPPIVAENINFAVSAGSLQLIVPELIENGTFDHPYLGLHGVTISPMMSRLNDVETTTEGVYVNLTVDGYPADEHLEGSTSVDRVTGIPIGGDVVVAIDDTDVGDTDALRNYLVEETRPGETVELTVLRDGDEEEIELDVDARPIELERIDVREPTM